MKKIYLILTLVLSVVILSSCGRDEDILRVGMDLQYPPFETVDSNNDPEGISVDIALALGEFIGKKVEIVNTNFLSIIPSLQAGEIDIAIASMSITPERQLIVDFTDPYFYFKIITLINKDFATENNLTEDSTVETLLAIEDAKYIGLASQVSTTIPISYGKSVEQSTSLATAIESVSIGTADILLMSANPVVAGYNANPTTTMVLWDPFVSSPIGMAVKKGNTELLDLANQFIDSMTEPEGLYAILEAKWDVTILNSLGRFGLEFYINE